VKTTEYLDAVKKRLAIASDYALQVPLAVTKQTISRYRNGGTFDHLVALRVADVLELAPEKVIADMELERTTVPELQAVWKRISRKVAGVLIPAVLAIGAASFPVPPAQAAFNNNLSPLPTEYTLRALRRRARRGHRRGARAWRAGETLERPFVARP